MIKKELEVDVVAQASTKFVNIYLFIYLFFSVTATLSAVIINASNSM